jgi:DNA-binding transcriptional LysR family regulator
MAHNPPLDQFRIELEYTMLEIFEAETFLTAVQAGGFSAAAKLLGVTPAVVGRRISTLEQRYGVRLIERTTRAQRLTPSGEAFAAKAAALLDAARELDEDMLAAPGKLEGRVRLTAPTTLSVTRLAPAVALFQLAHPDVTVEMVITDRRVDLVAEGFDFALRVGDNLQNSGLLARKVGTYSLALVATRSYLDQHGRPQKPSDLQAHRCIINLNISPRESWRLRQGAKDVVVHVRGGLQIDFAQALRTAALQGAGIAYLPQDLVTEDLATGHLERVMPDWEPVSFPIWLIYPSRPVTRRVTALIAVLEASIDAGT